MAQHIPLMTTLLGEHGGSVLPVVVVALHPSVLQIDFTVNCCGVVLAPGNVTVLLVVVLVSLAVSDMNV
jgi:hypothetical protein